MVLALSQSESVQKRLREEQLMNQEEEDLARALAASMLPSESYFPSLSNENPESNNPLDSPWIQSSPSHKPLASPPISLPVTPDAPSEETSGPSIRHNPYAEYGRYDKWRIPNRSEKRQEEAPKHLEPQPSPSVSSVSLLSYVSPKDGVKSSSQHGDAGESSDSFSETVLKFDNVAYARQPASDEERILNQPLNNEEGQQDGSVNQAKSSTSYGKQNVDGPRPQLTRVVSHDEPYGRQYPQEGQQDGSVNQAKSSTSYGKQNADGPRPQLTRVVSQDEPYGRQYPQEGQQDGSVNQAKSSTTYGKQSADGHRLQLTRVVSHDEPHGCQYPQEVQQDSSVNQAKSSSTSFGKQNAEGPRPQLTRVTSHDEPYDRQYPQEGQQDGSTNQAKSSSSSYGKQNAEGPGPQLTRVASHDEHYGRQYPQDARVSTNKATPSPPVSTYSPAAPSAFSIPPAPDYSFPSIGKANSYQPDIYQEKRKQSSLLFSPIAYPSLGGRRGSASDSYSETSQSQTSSSPIPHNDKPRSHLDVPQRPATSEDRHRRSTVPQPIATTSAIPPNQPPKTAGLLNINHFVDQELLRGVCMFSYYMTIYTSLNGLHFSYWVQKSNNINTTGTDARTNA